MIYVTSKMAAGVTYAFYAQNDNRINIVTDEITINGGADVINKRSLETPSGVVTEITEEQYEKLKTHPLFRQHLENGALAVLGTEKEAKTADKNLKEDVSRQLKPSDYEKKGKRKPKTKE